jgi:hypothetical protein
MGVELNDGRIEVVRSLDHGGPRLVVKFEVVAQVTGKAVPGDVAMLDVGEGSSVAVSKGLGKNESGLLLGRAGREKMSKQVLVDRLWQFEN